MTSDLEYMTQAFANKAIKTNAGDAVSVDCGISYEWSGSATPVW
jgi:hypothetical protein